MTPGQPQVDPACLERSKLYNEIPLSSFPFDCNLRLSDKAALALATGHARTSLSASVREFPQPPNRLAGIDVAGGQAGIFFYVPPMVAFFHTLTELVVGQCMVSLRDPRLRPPWVAPRGFQRLNLT